MTKLDMNLVEHMFNQLSCRGSCKRHAANPSHANDYNLCLGETAMLSLFQIHQCGFTETQQAPSKAHMTLPHPWISTQLVLSRAWTMEYTTWTIKSHKPITNTRYMLYQLFCACRQGKSLLNKQMNLTSTLYQRMFILWSPYMTSTNATRMDIERTTVLSWHFEPDILNQQKHNLTSHTLLLPSWTTIHHADSSAFTYHPRTQSPHDNPDYSEEFTPFQHLHLDTVSNPRSTIALTPVNN